MDLSEKDLSAGQWVMFSLQQPGDVKEIILETDGLSKKQLTELIDLFVTYNPMNLGDLVPYSIKGNAKKAFQPFVTID